MASDLLDDRPAVHRPCVFLSTRRHSYVPSPPPDLELDIRRIVTFAPGPLYALSDIILTHDWVFGPRAWSMDRLVSKIKKMVIEASWPITVTTSGRRGMPDSCTYQQLHLGSFYTPSTADPGLSHTAALEVYDMLCEEEIVEHPSQTFDRERLEEWLASRLLVLEKP